MQLFRSLNFSLGFMLYRLLDLRNGELMQVLSAAHGRADFYIIASLADRKVTVLHTYHMTNYNDGTYSKVAASNFEGWS